ncbi:Eukaryotic translation initiation factor 3 subunit E [Caligus rogercresseyi]|uniref:Eukaryotic translation initiation factor 3 subunit E n=1 Tax=Caligus rogercresseyi TaxID=217165 RepID=A0A7T8GPZ2_CALRO|nr:Eukaryotic translation initiation factor 3 subunit E [Caligus rogercresseyi]
MVITSFPVWLCSLCIGVLTRIPEYLREWDLTNKMTPYLDRHSSSPSWNSSPSRTSTTRRISSEASWTSSATPNMVDFAMDVHESLYPDKPLPSSLKDKRSESSRPSRDSTMPPKPVITLFSDPKIVAEIENSRDSKSTVEAHLEKAHINVEEMREKMLHSGQVRVRLRELQWSRGDPLLLQGILLPSDKNYLNALWGKLASEILMQSWDKAIMDLKRLQSFIDEASFGSSLQTLQQRTWLIHWSLFVRRYRVIPIPEAVFERHSNHLPLDPSLSLQASFIMKDLVKVIQEESYAYKDPITSFIEDLYVNFNFDGAQQKLRECEKVLVNDFFLVSCLDEFIENSRLMIFETFCRIHQCISIDMLAQKLNMKPENAERWIVNLIRNAKLDAKIDSQMGHVVMGKMTVSPYQQLIDKTKVLSLRTLPFRLIWKEENSA